MEPRELDPAESHGCDESKCVSKGNSDLYNGSFTCYGEEGTDYPMMCADGFVPAVVGDEPPFEGSGDISLQYFTCCPPGHLSSQAFRHCSDPISFESHSEEGMDSVCDKHDTRKFALQMKSSVDNPTNAFGTIEGETVNESFLCCDSMPDSDASTETTFLHDSECVPYRNEMYEPAKVHNKVGCIEDVTCSLQDFPFPRPMGERAVNEEITTTVMYQCCKSGPPLPPFVQDSAFRVTTYIPLFLYSVVVITSAIIILGLLIPLFIQLKNGTFQAAQRRGIQKPSSTTGSNKAWRSSSTLRGSSAKGSSTRGRASKQASSRSRGTKQCFSTYNVYLVYLALPDFVYALYEIWMYGSLINQQLNPAYYPYIVLPSNVSTQVFSPDWAIFVTYKYLNMAINAVVSYQILVLLRSSKRGIKVKPPSLKRVNVQAGIIYAAAVIYFLGFYFLRDAVEKAENSGDVEKKMRLVMILTVYKLLTGFSLAGYVVYVSIVVWWRDYLPPLNHITAKQRSMRELFFYFFRIVVLFIGIWLPCLILLMYACVSGETWPLLACSCAGAIQAILTACAILTKSDVRNYILDLVTLSYLRDKRSGDSNNVLSITGLKNPATDSGSMEQNSTGSRIKTPAGSIDSNHAYEEEQEESGSSCNTNGINTAPGSESV